MLIRRFQSLLLKNTKATPPNLLAIKSPFQRPLNHPFPPSRSFCSSLMSLNNVGPTKGARKDKKRKGRGIGSGLGKTAGRGHKGQKARGAHKHGFEGGQTPLRRRMPKRGFVNQFTLKFKPIGLGKLAEYINVGKIDSSELITMKTLKDAGAVGKKINDGVRLMARGHEQIQWPIHVEVSRVTDKAKQAIEELGGSVTKVYYNKLGLKVLLSPEWFEKKGRLLPKPARPPPKQRDRTDCIGRLPAPTKRYHLCPLKSRMQLQLLC